MMNQTTILEDRERFLYQVRDKINMHTSDLKEMITSLKGERPRRIQNISNKFYDFTDQHRNVSSNLEFEKGFRKLEEDNKWIETGDSSLCDELCFRMLSPADAEVQEKIITEPAGPREVVDYDKLISKLRACGLSESEIFPEKEDHDEKGPGGYSIKRLDKLSQPKPEATLKPDYYRPRIIRKLMKKKDKPPSPQNRKQETLIVETVKQETLIESPTYFVLKNQDDKLEKDQIIKNEVFEPTVNKSGISERLTKLAQPKPTRPNLNEHITTWRVSNAALNANSSLRLQQLAIPKASHNSRRKERRPPPAPLSDRIELLAKPKCVPYLEPDDIPVPKPVSRSALKAVASRRIQELSKPK